MHFCQSKASFLVFRYGFWYRPEISATGTSANTLGISPINIEVLQSSGNVAHSNGKSLSESSFLNYMDYGVLCAQPIRST
jgi:hypothetical protein